MKTLKTVPFGGRKFAVATPVNREQPKEEEVNGLEMEGIYSNLCLCHN